MMNRMNSTVVFVADQADQLVEAAVVTIWLKMVLSLRPRCG